MLSLVTSNNVRHGYGLFFFDRQKLLQILYEHIQHKDRIHLRKKVTEVSFVEKGVEVTCSDGSVVSGTFLVGADGIHSQVRRSMHRLGHTLEPGYFDLDEEDKVPCYYACSFGIAQHVPNWPVGQQSMVTGKGQSQLVVSGPDNRVYWFLFEKLPEIKYGKDIPRYTKEDEAEFVKRNHNVAITPEVTFGQVFAKRLSSTLTPLHEVVYKKWFFKRVITLGDSVHKVRTFSLLLRLSLTQLAQSYWRSRSKRRH
jgi:2-polyprenyl-6-methoxyphenol hydroxylase-like FAD-dependent oxidoreductase